MGRREHQKHSDPIRGCQRQLHHRLQRRQQPHLRAGRQRLPLRWCAGRHLGRRHRRRQPRRQRRSRQPARWRGQRHAVRQRRCGYAGRRRRQRHAGRRCGQRHLQVRRRLGRGSHQRLRPRCRQHRCGDVCRCGLHRADLAGAQGRRSGHQVRHQRPADRGRVLQLQLPKLQGRAVQVQRRCELG